MLSGLIVRMAHALQLNLEYAGNPVKADGSIKTTLWTYQEARRRLMWGCFVLDTWTGSGVDQLTLLHESDFKIRLPCSEANFLVQSPCITERLHETQTRLPSSAETLAGFPVDCGGLMSQYVRLVALWKRVARFVCALVPTYTSAVEFGTPQHG